MDELDFTLELSSDHLSQPAETALFTQAEDRLHSLSAGHSDLIGAAVNISQAAHGETPIHEVTVVVYSRPKHIAATEKSTDPYEALKGALDAAERQIRERRSKLKRHWEQPGNHPIEQEITEIIAAES